MNRLEQQVNYHDLGSLQQLKAEASKDEDGALKQAAKQFESIFMSMLLSSMRKANEAFEADGPMNSQTTGFYRDMYDKQLATELSEKGSLGLADLLVQQLKPQAYQKPQVKDRSEAAEQLQMPHRPKTELQLPHQEKTELHMQVRHQHSVTATTQPASPSDTGRQSAATATGVPPALSSAESAEPSASQDWSFDQPAEFIRKLLPAAEKAAAKIGLEPLALLAQAALETGWGQRMFKNSQGENSFNFFGIKAQPEWQGEVAVVDTLEYRQGVAAKEKAKFRAYSSPEQSLNDYADFIRTQPRYQQAIESASDPKSYFQKLQTAGYATDPNYAQKILSVFNSETFKQARNLLGTKDI